MKKHIYICIVFLSSYIGSLAQVKIDEHYYEIFLFGGGSYYIGDLNPTSHFRNTQLAFGGGLRLVKNPRFSHRIGIWYGNLYGDDLKNNSDVLRTRNLNFQSYVLELSESTEFNFVPFKPGNSAYSYFTPYLFGGIGVFRFDPVVYLDGQKYRLHSLRTEGKNYNLTQVAFPFGIGFKWALSKYINISLEWGIRKTFTDYIDDVSTVYPDPTTLNSAAAISLSNRVLDFNTTPINYTGRQRGNSKNKDWYVFSGLMLNISLPHRQESCPGVSSK